MHNSHSNSPVNALLNAWPPKRPGGARKKAGSAGAVLEPIRMQHFDQVTAASHEQTFSCITVPINEWFAERDWITANKKEVHLIQTLPWHFFTMRRNLVSYAKKSIRYFVVQCLIKSYFATFSFVSAYAWKDDSVKMFISKLCPLISLLLG